MEKIHLSTGSTQQGLCRAPAEFTVANINKQEEGAGTSKQKASKEKKIMTIRELIERLQGFENHDREIDFYVDEWNENTEDFDRGELLFTGEELEGDWVEMYFTKMSTQPQEEK